MQREYDEIFQNEVSEYSRLQNNYTNEMKTWQVQCQSIKTKLLQEVASLKIRVIE